MDEIIRLAATNLTNVEQTLYSNINGAIIKSIVLTNTTKNIVEATLVIDEVAFLVPLQAKEIKILNAVMVVNNIKASGNGIGVHVSGIQLGGV